MLSDRGRQRQGQQRTTGIAIQADRLEPDRLRLTCPDAGNGAETGESQQPDNPRHNLSMIQARPAPLNLMRGEL
jgi:hypothetical protein